MFRIISTQALEGHDGLDGSGEDWEGVRGGVASSFTHVGTAGLMSDFWLAAGLLPTVSSLSRMVFSVEMILRVAISRGRVSTWVDIGSNGEVWNLDGCG